MHALRVDVWEGGGRNYSHTLVDEWTQYEIRGEVIELVDVDYMR